VPLAIIGRYVFTPRGFIKFVVDLFRSVSLVGQIVTSGKFDIIYSNTLAVWTGAFVSKIKRKRHLWHVHELPPKSALQTVILRFLLTKLSSDIVCNSYATRNLWLHNDKIALTRAHVVWNGIAKPVIPPSELVMQFRESLGLDERDVLISCVGRIKDSKGQLMLLRVAELMWTQGVRDIHFLFVGDPPPGQVQHLDILKQAMHISVASEILHYQTFLNDIWTVWAGSDIAVIPSLEPESFGLVAIEAMAMSCPVVASAHGGIMEIIEDGVNGLLIPSGNIAGFAKALSDLVVSLDLRLTIGESGLKCFLDKFTDRHSVEAMNAVLLKSTNND
jgi:glycosyltransferase involved in cell wall biosynthesis